MWTRFMVSDPDPPAGRGASQSWRGKSDSRSNLASYHGEVSPAFRLWLTLKSLTCPRIVVRQDQSSYGMNTSQCSPSFPQQIPSF
jgi:hypothetical protein